MSTFTAEIDTAALLRALEQVGRDVEKSAKGAALVTANRIAAVARQRVARATGQTMQGVVVEEMKDGTGYVVLATNRRMPNLPLWIEHGTERGKPRSHAMAARPFFDVSARLEESAHRRRLVEAVQGAIDARGLGD